MPVLPPGFFTLCGTRKSIAGWFGGHWRPIIMSVGLMLWGLPYVAFVARADDPVNWPLTQAVITNDSARTKTLLAERHSQDELDFALIAAAGKGAPEPALLLLASGANPNRRVGPNGHWSVIVAIRENQLETLIVLLEHSGDPNGTDQMGWRPLHHTIGPTYERPNAIRALVQYGALVDSRDGLERTALHRAAGFGHAESVRVLLAVGADPSLRDKEGNSAIERALRGGHRDVAQLIQSHQVNPADLKFAQPRRRATMDVTQRDSDEMTLSLFINWLFGLFPVVVLRFLILRRPLGKNPAIWVTVGLSVLLFFTVTVLAHVAEIKPNMAPVALWTVLTYTILRAGRQRTPPALPKGTDLVPRKPSVF